MESAVDGAVSEERRRSEKVLDRILPMVDGRGGESPLSVDAVLHHGDHSNDLLEVRLQGRRLMLKRGVEEWAADGFRGAREASRLLAGETDVVVPDYLDLPSEVHGWPVLAWWRIPLPTLSVLWDDLGAEQRRSGLESCGTLLRRVHEIPVDGWGRLPIPGDRPPGPAAFLEEELRERLRNAAAGMWQEAIPLVDGLLERLPDVVDRVGPPRLAHGDPHLSNVLGEMEDGRMRCVGLLDLEAAKGGVPEVDLSYLALVHSPLLAGDLGEGWMERVLEGYGRVPDSELMAFFRVYHILNIGMHAVMNEWREHAAELARLGRETLERD